MKKTILPIIALAALAAACGGKNEAPKLHDRTDTLSWAMGENVAKSLKEGNVVKLDYDVFMKAVKHTLDGKEQPLSDETYQETMQYIMALAQMKQITETKKQEANIASSQAEYFSNLEKTNSNVKKHPSGFYYEVIKEGKGPKAKYGQVVSFDYKSYFMLSGQPFDQTYGQREPIEHVIGKPMFQGLVEGLQQMNAGSIYRFYFPHELAFGAAGNDDIPPYTPLIYEVEMHNIL